VTRTVTHIRVAAEEEAPLIARLISLAFQVEAFFKVGDRTNSDEVRGLMKKGEFLVLEDPAGTPAGCVHLKIDGDRGHFAMLSIDPVKQGKGFGRALVDEAEARCRAAGCRQMDIEVVNLRDELPPFYQRLGYVETGTAPFPDMEHSTMPCHFILMSKRL
jgi:N-acetylglutamate synthase-like GNAT family acetyltransferase